MGVESCPCVIISLSLIGKKCSCRPLKCLIFPKKNQTVLGLRLETEEENFKLDHNFYRWYLHRNIFGICWKHFRALVVTWWLGRRVKKECFPLPLQLLTGLFCEYNSISGWSYGNEYLWNWEQSSENLRHSVKAHLILIYAVGLNLFPFVSKLIQKSLIGKYLLPLPSVGLCFQTYSISSSVFYKLSLKAQGKINGIFPLGSTILITKISILNTEFILISS